MDNPRLSILLAAYNVAPYLEQCFQSIMPQLDDTIEVIVVDDGSTDDTCMQLLALKKAWPSRIQVISAERNQGLSAARNTLLNAARGEYIWFVDPDDMMRAGAIARLKSILSDVGPDLVICDFSVLDERKRKSWYSPSNRRRRSHYGNSGIQTVSQHRIIADMLLVDKLYVWTKIFKKSLYDSSMIFPEGRNFEDMHFSIGLAARSGKTFYANEPWVIYRRREGSILANMNEKKNR